MGIDSKAGSNSEQGDTGTVLGHAYTLCKIDTITKKDGSKQRLVKLRNPWGKNTQHTAYSNNHKSWDDVS